MVLPIDFKFLKIIVYFGINPYDEYPDMDAINSNWTVRHPPTLAFWALSSGPWSFNITDL